LEKSASAKSKPDSKSAVQEQADSVHKDLRDPVIVVSGLPRSGTSMMMQMLRNGGVELFTDQERKADESNPKGYLEHEAVKRLARDARWVKNARNKAVKIVARLLFHLPDSNNYKVIFMLRHIDEVINSQQQMLIRNKKEGAKNYPTNLVESYRKTLIRARKWGQSRKNVDVLYVEYSDAIKNPRKEASRVSEFLGGELDLEGMISAVDEKLYRIKV
jgi:hypothetical protein